MQEDNRELQQDHQRRADRIEFLVQEVSTFSDRHAREVTEELIQTLLDMYGEGLSRVLELTVETPAAGYDLIKKFTNDDLVASLLLLHGLHPVPLETRIIQALDEVRPYLKSHGGNVELISVEENSARLRLEGSCHGCPSSAMTLQSTIEEAIYKVAPDLDNLEVEGVAEPPRPPIKMGTPVTFVPRKSQAKDAPAESTDTPETAGGWKSVEGLASLANGMLRAITLEQKPLLFCQLGDTYYAYYNRCSSCQKPLDQGSLEGEILRCPTCGQHYDLHHAGRSVDVSDLFLQPIPLLKEGNTIKVNLPASAGNQTVLSAARG